MENDKNNTCLQGISSNISKSLSNVTHPTAARFASPFMPLVGTRQPKIRQAELINYATFLKAKQTILKKYPDLKSHLIFSPDSALSFDGNLSKVAYLFKNNQDEYQNICSLKSDFDIINNLSRETKQLLSWQIESLSYDFNRKSYPILISDAITGSLLKIENSISRRINKENINSLIGIISFQCIKDLDPEALQALMGIGNVLCLFLIILIIVKSNSNK